MSGRFLSKLSFKRSELQEIRKERRLTQQEFWGSIGITQSSGSRYESKRVLPKSLRLLLVIKYGEGVLVRNLVKKLRHMD